MNIVGIVVEYNPFHNGHLYNLTKAKELTNCDASVCVMSSNFTQRGIPAIVDKWARTEMALKGGVDLVLELPTIFSSQSAQYFSRAAVKILDSLGLVNFLCFGSESGNIDLLHTTAKMLYEEPVEYKDKLKEYLKMGISFPSARARALKQMLTSADIDNIVSEPNNILGIEYLSALMEARSSIIPMTIQRVKAHYNSKEIAGNIASATAIRHHIENFQQLESIQDAVPKETYNILQNCFTAGKGPVALKSFETQIFYRIITGQASYLSSIFDINEGLQNKIYKSYYKSPDLEALIGLVKSKRYTHTRIQRIFINILLNLTKDMFDTVKEYGPAYIRILGFNKKGQRILNEARKKSKLPIISNFSDIYKHDSSIMHTIADFENVASNIYYTAYSNPGFIESYQEHKRKVVIYDN